MAEESIHELASTKVCNWPPRNASARPSRVRESSSNPGMASRHIPTHVRRRVVSSRAMPLARVSRDDEGDFPWVAGREQAAEKTIASESRQANPACPLSITEVPHLN